MIQKDMPRHKVSEKMKDIITCMPRNKSRQDSPEVQHVRHILARDLGNGNVEDVQILAFDEVEQQIQRSLEGFEKHLQGIGRNVEIVGQLSEWCPLNNGERDLFLIGLLHVGRRFLRVRLCIHHLLSLGSKPEVTNPPMEKPTDILTHSQSAVEEPPSRAYPHGRIFRLAP